MSIIYRQYDSRWGNLSYPDGNTMAGSGCGPTACANVIANISNSSVTPKDTRAFMLKNNYAVRNAGTAWAGIPACLKNWGYEVTDCPNMSTVWTECAKGDEQGVILFNAGTRGGVTWTTDGHFVAFTDYRIDGGKHWFYTRDSGPRKNDGWHCYETQMQGLIIKIWTCHHSSANKTTYIEYNANGGTGAPAKQSYTYSATEYTNISSIKPVRENYTFLGWSLSSTATKPSYQPGERIGRWSRPSTGNTYTFYAIWEKQLVVKIRYDANGGTNAPGEQSYLHMSSGVYKLSTEIPTRSGYKFLGWSIDKSATKASYQPGQNWARTNTGPVYTLYAVWQATTAVKRGYTGTFPTGIISFGSTGENVKNLQRFLNWYFGKSVLVVDGECGTNTISQLKIFQKNCKLTADGICGEKTIAAMRAVKK